jgi:hypothetical protein
MAAEALLRGWTPPAGAVFDPPPGVPAAAGD